MKWKFDALSQEISRITTRRYSTSFSLGIYFLSHRIRDAVYAIYGFVRVADEIVDSFTNYDKRTLLSKFKEDTFEAIRSGISVNPILNSFQLAVRQYNIHHDLIEMFLYSMEMDLEKVQYDRDQFQQYILGSAEVVGLMCLHVFTEGNQKMYDELKPYAMKLGAAFQKVNFLRDLKSDYYVLGRIYFPDVELATFSHSTKRQIEAEIANDFAFALKGIKMLPSSSKGGVYLAYVYYQSLFKKIKRLPPQKILSERIRINNGKKLGLMINTFLEFKINIV